MRNRVVNKQLSQIAWFDGMALRPEHFHLQAEYCSDTIEAFPTRSYPSWGFLEYQIDSVALETGFITLANANGFLPSGTPFCAWPRYLSREITGSMPALQDASEAAVFLVVGNSASTSARIDEGIASEVYLKESEERRDEEVKFLRPVCKLALDGEEFDHSSAVPIARIRRDHSGVFRYDSDFVPPCLRVQASNWLVSQIELLYQRIASKTLTTEGAWDSSESLLMAQLWFVPSLYSALSSFRRLLDSNAHPFRLFISMAQIASVLGTAGDLSPDALPLYNHLDLSGSFSPVIDVILSMLDLIFPPAAIPVELKQLGPSLFATEGTVSVSMGPRWILAVRPKQLTTEVIPSLVKVASTASIKGLAVSATPGLPLRWLSVESVPSGIERKAGVLYFEVGQPTPFSSATLISEWQTVVNEGALGVYAPSRFFEAGLELFNLVDK